MSGRSPIRRFCLALYVQGLSIRPITLWAKIFISTGLPVRFGGNFNLEQQGAIVDQWFAGDLTVIVPNRSPMNPNDPYFVYIRDNLRAGRT